MARKQVIFAADSLDAAHKFRRVLDGLDVSVKPTSIALMGRTMTEYPDYDLLIVDAQDVGQAIVEVGKNRPEDARGLLLVVSPDDLAGFRLPAWAHSDFIVRDAGPEECEARVRLILWPGNEGSSDDLVTFDDMTLNLATYQVTVAGEPIDFTYLEYALLAFLVTHPDRTYSRDALLKRVWGFDYYGGTRTVDVHVRRVRAKLGPELSQHLETVRGVGYLWNA
ncbi:MAG: response regulator transcription factor [Coriobacteriaceae bacterium]|nr:response regulator transcription factor [Coriobacteriaceae bacterium]